MTRKMMLICDHTEMIYADRMKALGQKLYGRHSYYYYAIRTSSGLKYHYELNLSKQEYEDMKDRISKRLYYYTGVKPTEISSSYSF